MRRRPAARRRHKRLADRLVAHAAAAAAKQLQLRPPALKLAVSAEDPVDIIVVELKDALGNLAYGVKIGDVMSQGHKNGSIP